ncbi:MAG: DUF1929 domain-containing protein [Verrucomicrobiota bacterium]|nr:DUF1929 domain-containing protein [Verrucomicrobiota bacterium]
MKTYPLKQLVPCPRCIFFEGRQKKSVSLFARAILSVLCVASFVPFTLAQGDPKDIGKWGDLIKWPNVGIHVHVLPSGKVLFWGRREWKPTGNMPADGPDGDLDTHECTPRIWDPKNPDAAPLVATSPLLRDGPKEVNLFCSGHTFMPDGSLLVVGGHLSDSHGSNKVRIFNTANTWEEGVPMGGHLQGGRWYPTAVTLADGGILVLSGDDQNGDRNPRLQVFRNKQWDTLETAPFNDLPYYPWMHVIPDGRVLLAGWSRPRKTQLLDTGGEGSWKVIGEFNGKDREYGSSVMYAPGKVLITGGGIPPQETAEIIDATNADPKWEFTGPMAKGRRHHNSTILPDGTVLITGGSSGQGGPNGGFNDVNAPVKTAELWTPPKDGTGGKFIPMAAESESRLYHSTAVLLPDGRVLSAGGGEYRPNNVMQNDPQHSLRNAQIFSPPYLFKGPRPDISGAPSEVAYGETFTVGTSNPNEINRVSWIRLSSVTHSFNQGQRINFLSSTVVGGALKVTAPATPGECPPGHYMLFLLSASGVPSESAIIRIR